MKAKKAQAIRQKVKDEIEANEQMEATGDKEGLSAANMSIWDKRVVKHIKAKNLTVNDIEQEVIADQEKKDKRKIGPFEFDVGFDNEFPGEEELSEVLNDNQVYNDLVELQKILGKTDEGKSINMGRSKRKRNTGK
jgi:hypothetical protein